MPVMKCRTEFDPTVYPIPPDLHNLLLGTGWMDDSEAGDGCPSFLFIGGANAYRLWVESWVPFVRDSLHRRRFTLAQAELEWVVLWETDNEEEAYARVVEMMRGEWRE